MTYIFKRDTIINNKYVLEESSESKKFVINIQEKIRLVLTG